LHVTEAKNVMAGVFGLRLGGVKSGVKTNLSSMKEKCLAGFTPQGIVFTEYFWRARQDLNPRPLGS